MTVPTDLDALAALAREGTPGEWLTLAPGEIYVVDENGYKRLIAGTYRNSRRDANAAYIAAANPAAVLALIELLAQCKATLEALHPEAGLPDSDVARLYNAMMEKLT